MWRRYASANYAITGSRNGLCFAWRQAIKWGNADLLSIWPPRINFGEIWIKIIRFSINKMPRPQQVQLKDFKSYIYFVQDVCGVAYFQGYFLKWMKSDNLLYQLWSQLFHSAVMMSWHGNAFRIMMTSSNGNISRVTGHLCGEFTGPRWIPHTKASDAELWYFLWSACDLKRYRAHYDVTVMTTGPFVIGI